ncbi:tRNA (5-methylaminomethyl-2-thiouridine)(34)-methyltransferase MnmD [Pedobacter sp. HMF7056]|uniref:tRNA (5-methylaminomethyl-2-thiouridine)(34)-methyltransferase MnmD n=1 Tax=Hufsiella ginkgonis TaxID=2695274 RepID=A0A7K1XVJ9_9SPHI|nr:tRNA (5-methylaminomethyl-2-thiouridine)(34)-methyltransferase MnmD [Hufsiella ginkgonis]
MTLVLTSDGSNTLFNSEVGEHYHSRHGALQESKHVFLEAGLKHFTGKNHPGSVAVLEAGFGTGLNFMLSADWCLQQDIALDYTGIEAFPVTDELFKSTGYDAYISGNTWQSLAAKYLVALSGPVMISDTCKLAIDTSTFADFDTDAAYDVLYFDAFAAVHQPELWTHDAIAHLCSFLKPGGVFVTYAITGNLKRTMKALGFTVEKLPGAPGKREMLRAVKGPSPIRLS